MPLRSGAKHLPGPKVAADHGALAEVPWLPDGCAKSTWVRLTSKNPKAHAGRSVAVRAASYRVTNGLAKAAIAALLPVLFWAAVKPAG